jgi:peptidyl-dipeptidase A
VAGLTEAPYAALKRQIDQETAARYGIAPAELRMWHYDDWFFASSPAMPGLVYDDLLGERSAEEIIGVARGFFEGMGFEVEGVLSRSDLGARDGKYPGAFTTDLDRAGDVRILATVGPSFGSLSTLAHELGHAVDTLGEEPGLPYLLKVHSHPLAAEAIALLFEDELMTPDFWANELALAPARLETAAPLLLKKRVREAVVFARFSLVMFNFEKALYEDPDQDLNALWWDLVERYQQVPRPEGRDLPDWACRSHFTANPVYYQNYLLGMLLEAELRRAIARQVGWKESTFTLGFSQRTEIAGWLKRKVFRWGKRLHWFELSQVATGAPMTAQAFIDELD